ncbi:MAG: glycoside hydrolase family 88 protein [Clostridia bacterium]|nr:glycoside hydrolase family 88 protein [Clostridia bacterium]
MNKLCEMSEMELAELMCTTMMKKFRANEIPPIGRFHYHMGVFLSGVEQTFLNTGKREYADYIKKAMDSFVTDEGEVIGSNPAKLDDKQPAILLFRILDETGEEKYEKAIKFLKHGLDSWPLTKDGGFWHMNQDDVREQMWLDSIYMAGELLARFGARYNDIECFDAVCRQARLMWNNMRDKKTGLLYHAWDTSREAPWADKENGLSAEFWGRAAGWYITALTTIIEYLPDDYTGRKELIGYVREYVDAVVRVQDEKTGLWYQVLDKGDRADNWIETSCSALFLCGITKALKAGYIDDKYEKNADMAFNGLKSVLKLNDDGDLICPSVCIGTGIGSYSYYIERPVSDNDLHGVGAFLLGLNAYHQFKKNRLKTIAQKERKHERIFAASNQ